jgi:hypothetical protein
MAAVAAGTLLALGVRAGLSAPDTSVPWSVFGSGGTTNSSSASYALGATAGQTAIGPAGSATRELGAGFWYMCRPATTENDCDGTTNAIEVTCDSDADDPLSVPERVDGAFAGVDDDGDTQVDEALPGGASGFDCDGDGWTGTQEGSIYTSGGRDQDACGNNGWPAELFSDPPSGNKVTLQDIGSFHAPVAHFNTSVGTFPGDERWDLIPNGLIQLQDIGAIHAGVTAMPGMFWGGPIFNGPVCPWPP